MQFSASDSLTEFKWLLFISFAHHKNRSCSKTISNINTREFEFPPENI